VAAASNIFPTRNSSLGKRLRCWNVYPPHCVRQAGRSPLLCSFRSTLKLKLPGTSVRKSHSSSAQDMADAGLSWATTNGDLIALSKSRNAPCTVRGNRIAFALRDHLSRAGISAAGPSLTGVLRHLIIRTTKDDREAVAMLVVTRNDKSLRKPVRALLQSRREDGRPGGFFINIHDSLDPFMTGPKTIRIEGRSHVRETVGGLSYLISPAAFFQTNARAAAVLQRCVMESVCGARRVLDLYCGSGLFSLPLAAAGVRVDGIDENSQAIRDAKMNVRLNRIPEGRVRFWLARVEDGLARTPQEGWDAVILDPPRQGCRKPILAAVFQDIAPLRVVYVSCNPDTLALELSAILKAGYRAERIEAVDMFPHTEHIETVVRLVRKG